METKDVLRLKTKKFALEIISFFTELPRTRVSYVMGDQLLRCGTSVGANYRASCRARSQADFISKMGIVEEEADESKYWMELFTESGIINEEKIEKLYGLASEITAMTVASIRTARKRKETVRA
jgi:four helix bundle protein